MACCADAGVRPISGRQWGYGAALTGSIGGCLPVSKTELLV